jgi:type I site-specific restriction endonuclease
VPSPEERARENIDKLLTACGWDVQGRKSINLDAARGVVIREALLKGGDEADYLLFVDRKAIGTVEAKPEGHTLTGVEEQSDKYGKGLLDIYPKWREPLPFAYESTGVETQFTNQLDPSPKSRNVFAFHRPETLLEYLEPNANLNTRLANLLTTERHRYDGTGIDATQFATEPFHRPQTRLELAALRPNCYESKTTCAEPQHRNRAHTNRRRVKSHSRPLEAGCVVSYGETR